VNGDIPVAAFAVENANTLCSANDVVFDDQSTVNFGNVVKVIWYFDYNNNPTDTAVYYASTIPADRKIHHKYGAFGPASKSFLVRMDVYSGISCVNSTDQSITVYPTPAVSINTVGPICLGSPPVQLTTNNNGFGTGIFSGPGVSSTGLFDPAKTGVGAFTVKYVVVGQGGCADTTTEQMIVNPVPEISLPPAIDILTGDQVRMPAHATGDSLTYSWTPSAGLSQDNILAPLLNPTENTTYKLVVSNPQGCIAVAQIDVSVLNSAFIPNAFTPNGDGINDTWQINFLSGYPNCTVAVYNRYGQKVFSSIGYAIPWDGTYRGTLLPAGAYYYMIDPKDGRRQLSGSVTIVR
jgi:gliding motility-associated-like protein